MLTCPIVILTMFSGVMFDEHDASRLSTRDIPSSSRSLEAPPFNYDDIKRENPSNGPRFISRNADGTFPSISRPLADEPTTTVFPAYPTQQVYAGPLAELDGTTTRTKSPWNRFFSSNERTATARPSAGQLKISHPVVHDDPNNEHNPLRRIQTIDLATAMEHDRERRQIQATISPNLIATRPAPQPPRPSTAGAGLSRSRSDVVIRKKPVRATAPPGVLSPDPFNMPVPQASLDVEPQAATSSMQLSPGMEAMRRRSPRQSESRPATQTWSTTPTSARIQSVRQSVPDVPPLPPFKFSNTPQVSSHGLPSNPKAGPRVAPPRPAPPKQSTDVMLVTEIVYRDLDTVRAVLHKKAKSAPLLPKSIGSVVHRPRPIPRNQEDRQVFPAETSLHRGHRRSLSSGSLITGKSILWVNAGDPKTLPPLPEFPKSAESAIFPPNVMAHDGQRASDRPVQSRRASAIQDRKSVIEDLRQAQERLRLQQKTADGVSRPNDRLSAATTKESVRTVSLFDFDDHHSHEDVREDNASTIGPATAKELEGDSESWRRKTQSSGRSSAYTSRSQRRSSPVLPDFRHLTFSPSDSIPATAASTWEMPAAMQMPVSKHQAHSTYISKDKPASPVRAATNGNGCEAIITVMLDDGPVASGMETPRSAESYSESEDDETTPVQSPASVLETRMPARFHRQVGDKCPTFSTRKTADLKKRVPPPPPLPLSMRTRPMIIQTAEPSPIESPEEAYRMIQQQLDELDRPEGQTEDKQEHEIALLADLEAEMGLQENRWQDLHKNMDRESISTFASTPEIRSRPASSVARSSIRTSQGDLAGVYGAFLQPGRVDAQMPVRGSGLANSLEYLRGGNNKERLSQAEWYMQSSAQLSSKSAGTTMTKITMVDIGSPSPPDTNESDFEIDLSDELDLDSPVSINDFPMVPPPCLKLWQPQQVIQKFASEPLWAAPAQIPQTPDLFAELASIPVFVRTRRTFEEPLFVGSSRLWAKPVANKAVHTGMWQKAQPLVTRTNQLRAKTLPPRPLTVRPPRRQKRVSQLADILESPKELPNKRGTMGFFQFPWGEQSEHPVVFQRPIGRLTAMPGTMSTGTSHMSAILEARARQLAAQEQAIQDLAGQRNKATSPGDDEFDENTLWEIANLLRADQVPSRESMFGSLDDYENEDDDDFNMDDYAAELLSDNGEDDSEETTSEYSEDDELPYSFEIVSGSPVSVVSSVHSLSGAEPAPSLLWDKTSGVYHKTMGFGLDQPSEDQWSSYAKDVSERPVFRRLHEPAAAIESASLWASPAAPDSSESQTASLWMKPLPALPVIAEAPRSMPIKTSATVYLWSQSEAVESSQVVGLSQPKQDEWMSYMADAAQRPVARRMTEQASSIGSTSLWTSTERQVTIKAEQSLLWSGAASQATNSAKASSLWRLSKMQVAAKQAPAHGLPQPKEAEWQFYTNNDKEERLASRQQAGELDLLESNSMWGLPETQLLCEKPTSYLWGQRAVAIAAPVPVTGTVIFHAEASSAVAEAALWTKAAAAEHKETSEWLFNPAGKGKDHKRTSREILSVSGARPAAVRHEPVAELQTTSLWAKDASKASNKKTTSFLWGSVVSAPAPILAVTKAVVSKEVSAPVSESALWTKAAVNKQAQASEGLFSLANNGKDRKRTSREIISIGSVRAVAVRNEPVAELQTTSLWAKGASQAFEEQTSSLLWGQATFVPAPVVTVAEVAVSEESSIIETALWTKTVTGTQTQTPKGLFSLANNGKDRKRTSREIISVSSVRAVAVRNEPLAGLQTTSLWAKDAAVQVQDAMWMTSKPAAAAAAIPEPAVVHEVIVPVTPAALWKKTETLSTSSTGLWSARQMVAASATPAGFEFSPVDFVRKARAFTQEPLPTISSTELWSSPTAKPARRSTWLGFASTHRPASGCIAYTPLWSRGIRSSSTDISATIDTTTASKRGSKVKSMAAAFEPKSDEATTKPVWTRPSSIAQPKPISRVQSFAEDDFFNHFGGASSRRQTVIQQQQQEQITEEEEQEELPPKPSNSTWLSTWGWKKSN